jgi:hypothetical protein
VPPRYYNSREAAEYLRIKWGMSKFTTEAFRAYRHRQSIDPNPDNPRAARDTFWTKEELDRMKPVDRAKQRYPKTEVAEALDEHASSMVSFA